ncbi:MAG: glucosyl-3-phosphoglycerate synthase [Solirubrobacteraceae bacterium]
MSLVVVPARDEQDQIEACLRALAAQELDAGSFGAIIVLDTCSDRTGDVARRTAAQLGLDLTLLEGPGQGAGAARKLGMDAAARRLLGAGTELGLIACTDADSRPAPDWLARQLAHVRTGARAIAGVIVLDPDEAALLPGAVRRRRSRDARARLARVREHDPDAGHHHFAGASLGVTAGAYRQVGGLEPLVALEDAAFAERLRRHRIPIVRACDVVVLTSARSAGRARRGLAVDLAVSSWAERRRYDARDFSPEVMSALADQIPVTVVIPTRECAATIAGVIEDTVRPLMAAGLVDEVLVVDAASADGTAELAARAGARVLQQDLLLGEYGPALGKGDAMWRAVHETAGEIICFLDGDTADPDPRHLLGLLGPLLCDGNLQLVKGTFERPFAGPAGPLAHEGGRVTELMARPLLNLHFPLLAGFTQPLAGEFAARRQFLEGVDFPAGYGVEIALLIDALRLHGLDALAECQLGTRQNHHQPLRALGEMAYAVLAAVERRLESRPSPVGGHYLRPWDDMLVAHVPIDERPPLSQLKAARGAAGLSLIG